MKSDHNRGANLKNIFSKSIDIKALEKFNDAIKSSTSYSEAYKSTMTKANEVTRKTAVDIAKGKVSFDDLACSFDRITLSAKAGQIAMKGLSIAGNLLAGMAIGAAINFAVKAIDHYVNRVKYAREALADANAEYKNTVSEIESINTELDSLAEKMHALTIVSAERLQVKILSAVKVHLLIQFRQKASRKKVLYTPPSIE